MERHTCLLSGLYIQVLASLSITKPFSRSYKNSLTTEVVKDPLQMLDGAVYVTLSLWRRNFTFQF